MILLAAVAAARLPIPLVPVIAAVATAPVRPPASLTPPASFGRRSQP